MGRNAEPARRIGALTVANPERAPAGGGRLVAAIGERR